MTVKEAIRKADELRPNTASDELKAGWLYRLECEICEHLGLQEPKNEWPEKDAVLMMPDERSEIYPMYLMAQIDLFNEESGLYGNDSIAANQAITEAEAWIIRTHEAPKKQILKWW